MSFINVHISSAISCQQRNPSLKNGTFLTTRSVWSSKCLVSVVWYIEWYKKGNDDITFNLKECAFSVVPRLKLSQDSISWNSHVWEMNSNLKLQNNFHNYRLKVVHSNMHLNITIYMKITYEVISLFLFLVKKSFHIFVNDHIYSSRFFFTISACNSNLTNLFISDLRC